MIFQVHLGRVTFELLLLIQKHCKQCEDLRPTIIGDWCCGWLVSLMVEMDPTQSRTPEHPKPGIKIFERNRA